MDAHDDAAMTWKTLSFDGSQEASAQLWALADFYASQHPDRERFNVAGVFASLRIAAELGQLAIAVEDGKVLGMVSWLRADEPHTFFTPRTEEAIRAAGEEQLRTGRYLMIAEILALEQGFAYKAVRALSRLPGVESVCGWNRREGAWREKKTHGRVEQRLRREVELQLSAE